MTQHHYVVPSATAAAIAAHELRQRGFDAFVSPPPMPDGAIPLTVVSDRYDLDDVVTGIEPSARRADADPSTQEEKRSTGDNGGSHGGY